MSLWTVQELFGDIGPLKNARLVKPGVADVIFVNVEDALAAVKTYHMRLLDGKYCSTCDWWIGKRDSFIVFVTEAVNVGCWYLYVFVKLL